MFKETNTTFIVIFMVVQQENYGVQRRIKRRGKRFYIMPIKMMVSSTLTYSWIISERGPYRTLEEIKLILSGSFISSPVLPLNITYIL